MKNLIKTSILGLVLVMSAAVFAQDKMSNNIDNSNIALSGYSPVSYLDLGLAQRGNKAYMQKN